jgi:hypothetical protein
MIRVIPRPSFLFFSNWVRPRKKNTCVSAQGEHPDFNSAGKINIHN